MFCCDYFIPSTLSLSADIICNTALSTLTYDLCTLTDDLSTLTYDLCTLTDDLSTLTYALGHDLVPQPVDKNTVHPSLLYQLGTFYVFLV